MNRLFYFFGLIIPIPLFFDLYSLSFFINQMTNSALSTPHLDFANFFFYKKDVIHYYKYFAGSYASSFAPVPIGIITFGFVFFLPVLFIKQKIYTISIDVLNLTFLLMFFTLLSISNIGALKTLMLLFPFCCMFFVIQLTKNIRVYEKICSGYVVSFLFFILLHFLSTFYFIINDVKDSFFHFNYLFGIQLYQALVSYSAVLSYAAITLIIFTLFKRNYLQRITIYFFVLIILFLLSLGARKAVLLDFGILIVLLALFEFIRAIFMQKIMKIHIVTLFLCTISLILLLMSTGYNKRGVSLDIIQGQREEHYVIFFNKIADADFSQLLFGHGGGWGGLSNIYFEMIYRLGILGFFIYVISFLVGLVIIRKHIKNLFNFNNHNFYFRLWFWFTISTVLLSNVFNMNLQLPYYSMNLTMIMMVFLHKTKTISTQS